MAKQIGELDRFVQSWGKKNRKIAVLHEKEIKKGNEIPIMDILEKKKR